MPRGSKCVSFVSYWCHCQLGKGALGPHWKSKDESPQMVTGRSLRVREEYSSMVLTKQLYLIYILQWSEIMSIPV